MSDPKAEYSSRLETYLQIAAAKNRIHIQIGNLKLAVVAVGLVVVVGRSLLAGLVRAVAVVMGDVVVQD